MTLKYHFIGIGGIGMSGLARLLRRDGIAVSGSDQLRSVTLDDLRALGATVFAEHAAAHVPADAVVVTSDAVPEKNPEVCIARERGQRIARRSELLGEMMAKKTGVAIAGTHGKTTTTAMVGHVMLENGLDPTVVVGGAALGTEGNAHAGQGRFFVAEACEAYGSFLHLSPRIAVVTNIEADHLDYHHDFDHIRADFRKFADRILPDGTLIVNADNAEAAALAAYHTERGGRVDTYGLQSGRLQARAIAARGTHMTFEVADDGRRVASARLRVPGLHNVSNAMAAFLVGLEAGLTPERIAAALESFEGVSRRFDPLGERDGVRVYDDYAHHPTEIRATLSAARAAFGTEGDGRIIAVFQPHQHSRTQNLMDEFIASFDDADLVVVTDIFQAREEPIPGVSSASMVQGIAARCPDKEVWYIPEKADVPALLGGIVRSGDVVITMGAGDIRSVAERFLAASRAKVAA